MKLKPILYCFVGALGAAVAGVLFFFFSNHTGHGHNKWDKTYIEMGEVQKALNLYKLKHDSYPSELQALEEDWFPNGLPKDRFTKEPYTYVTDGYNFVLISYGHDEKPSGSEENETDIVYTEFGCLTPNR